MFNQIPQQRIVVYLLALGVIPVLLVVSSFFSDLSQIHEIESSILQLQSKTLTIKQQQAQNLAIRQQYKDVDHFYIDQQLETLTFREKEREGLQRIVQKTDLPEDDQLKKRLDFLSGKNNKLLFAEGVVQTTPTFQEVVETLVHPVEIDSEDLEKILSTIEGMPLGTFHPPSNRPQLIITEFRLEKKADGTENEVFQLNMKLLRREFL